MIRREGAEPLVSVCIPTYNQAQYLGQCIHSVLEQTHAHVEVVVQDDCSSDATEEVVQAFRARGRVSYERNARNLGPYPTMNRAAARARGTYLKFLCSDDWLLPQCLERAVEMLEANPQVAFVAVDQYSAWGDSNDYFPWPSRIGYHFVRDCVVPGPQVFTRYCQRRNFYGGNSDCILRRTAFDQVGGYDESYGYYGDEDLYLRLARVGDVGVITERLFVGRHHKDSSSSTYPMHKRIEERFRVIDRNFQDVPRLKRRLYRENAGHALGLALRRFLRKRPDLAVPLVTIAWERVAFNEAALGFVEQVWRRVLWRGAPPV